MAEALSDIRKSGRAWPPTAPEFRAMCVKSSADHHPPFEACMAELNIFVRDNRKDTHNLSPILYHTIRRNLDFYNYKKLEKEYERIKAFEIAFKATLFQLECGEKLEKPPAPETLLESVRRDSYKTPEAEKLATETMSTLLSMFGDDK